MISISVLSLLAPLPVVGEMIEWESQWHGLGECNGLRFEYRASKNPANERLGFRATNGGGEPVAGTAQIEVQRDDGSWAGLHPLIAGSLPSGGYEGWIAPGATVAFPDYDVASENPHPVTGIRPAGASIKVSMTTMTKSRYEEVIKASAGAYIGMQNGSACPSQPPIPFGWRQLHATQRGPDGKLYELSQSINTGEKDGAIEVDIKVASKKHDVYAVKARFLQSKLKSITIEPSGIQELAFGKYVCVDIVCTEETFQLSSTDGRTNRDKAGILYFRSVGEARQAAASLRGSPGEVTSKK